MSEFVKALDAADLPPGACREVRVGDRMIAIYNVEGVFHATANACLHRGGPLGQGVLDGATVLCPWHAWGWDVKSGEHTQNPSMKLQTHAVKVEGGAVLVEVG